MAGFGFGLDTRGAGRHSSVRCRPPLAQEAEELRALAKAPLRHVGAPNHFADDRGDLGRAQVEAAVEGLDRIESLGVAEAGIVQRGHLHAVVVNELGVGVVEPPVLERLLIEVRPGIGRAASETWSVCGLTSLAKAIVSLMVSCVSPGRPMMNVPWMTMPRSRQSLVNRLATSIRMPFLMLYRIC